MNIRRVWSLLCILCYFPFIQTRELGSPREADSEDNVLLDRDLDDSPPYETQSNDENAGDEWDIYADRRNRIMRQANVEKSNRKERQLNFEDPRATLGNTGIGPSFRNKRDQPEENMDKHAFQSEEDALAAAAENVAAGDNSVAAAIETEEARQAFESQEHDAGREKTPKIKAEDSQKDFEPSEHKVKLDDNSMDTHKNASVSLLPVELNRDGPLKKLMSESSDLAKELRIVFDILAKRESQLVEEMERLKVALTGGVAMLKKPGASPQSPGRFRRDYSTAEAPYRACVYIEASPEGDVTSYDQDAQSVAGRLQGQGQEGIRGRSNDADYPPEPIIREFIPSDSNQQRSRSRGRGMTGTRVVENSELSKFQSAALTQESSENDISSSSTSGDDIDLSKVYWLKLPTSPADNRGIKQKVHKVFSEVMNQGKDAIIIPVSRGFASSEEVSRGFLRAVRVKQSALKSKYFRKLRSLNVREVH